MENTVSERAVDSEVSEAERGESASGEPREGFSSISVEDYNKLDDEDKAIHRAIYGEPKEKNVEATNVIDTDTSHDDDNKEEEKQKEDLPPLVAPFGFKNKEGFYNSPREVQQEIVDRFKGMEQKLQERASELGDLRKFTGELGEVLTPVKSTLESLEITPTEYIRRLVEIDSQFRENPNAAAIRLLNASGINKEEIARIILGDKELPPAPAPVARPNKDPEIEELKAAVARYEQEREEAWRHSAVEWLNQVDEFGNKLRIVENQEQINALDQCIADIAYHNKGLSPKDVYDQAYREYLKIFPQIAAKHEGIKLKNEVASKAQRVTAAKKASSPVTTSGDVVVTNNLPSDPSLRFDAALDRIFRR